MSDNLRARAEERVNLKIKFLRNLKAYIIVNAILFIINALFSPSFWWVMFPVFFWGIGVLADFLKAYVFVDNFDSDDYRERKIQEEMEKLRN
ncbi:MAG: 2TM domain-containing protein [Methanobrevibacter sp.]|uniref:2TM domain-containing protein n=1 Tax=uncultured Methanobrevibacter sp. TaxID=253161 RepID=UPI00260048DC|nr:2TM domain-containing protein [uncultured Methanobrevibacter sp.]MEE1128577.1 2TM domain-containing protein [Methanobrevibacter sp.]